MKECCSFPFHTLILIATYYLVYKHYLIKAAFGCYNLLVRGNPPPPFIDTKPRADVLFGNVGSKYTTTTVMSSWKCLLTPLSIFFKSEYLISLFLAAI